LIIAGLLAGCQENDDVGPIITLTGADTVDHVLNEEYTDDGATATDETDGDVSDKIYIDNQVNIDMVGEYTVTYSVVDEAGNEGQQVQRTVNVYNTANNYNDDYLVTEYNVPTGQDTCKYSAEVWIDSTVNNRIIMYDFACNSQRQVFANIDGQSVVLPYQLIDDSVLFMSLQGSGFINDSIIFFEYQKIDSVNTTYWNVYFNRVNENR